MTTKQVHLFDLHHEHKIWQNELSFQRQEIGIFEQWLAEVAKKNTAIEVKMKVEHFQNQFILHREILDTLIHDIKVHEQHLGSFAQENPVAIDHVRFTDHNNFREKIETQGTIYNSLKDEFKRFTSASL